ncbi:MAG: SAM-dependent chlorinase/fluorinase [Thermomicrobium sp.]|nr:SAM-dependent chlorinase/fluorinase [Thermomicrobium sp.]MCS7246205.1 SAM-dependent chlorinase/fluorinase [Thermomicrobium sp.]MDW7982336.1 SAM-dependent chlorinase/fluorinase [Thermomicrobium sp.]
MAPRWRANGLVTFLSDYGLQDSYVAQVKGVILSHAPQATLIDVTHLVPPQDILEGAFQLATVWRSFPPGTIHLAVVDPGVGTARRAVLLGAENHFFVLPDNGLATFVLADAASVLAWHLDRPAFFRSPVAPTFHGRDVFAPIVAALLSGYEPAVLGTPIDASDLIRLPIPIIRREDARTVGPVVSIDRFGNCRTLIRREQLPGPPDRLVVQCNALVIRGLARTFADVPPGHPLALIGSHGGLELAVRDGNAADVWAIRRGDLVEIRIEGS